MLIYTCPCCGRQIKFPMLLKGILVKRDRTCKRCEKTGRTPKKARKVKNGKVN